jgi:2-iminobutanoate/2-iminopropanoate deaminase
MGPAPLSAAIDANGLIFVSGQVAIDPRTGTVVGADVAGQTRQIFRNMQELLDAAGLGLDHLVKTTAFLADLTRFAEMNAVYEEVLSAPYPARSTVGVTLNDPRLLVEIEGIAVR